MAGHLPRNVSATSYYQTRLGVGQAGTGSTCALYLDDAMTHVFFLMACGLHGLRVLAGHFALAALTGRGCGSIEPLPFSAAGVAAAI